jgi:hypothetical protein
MVLGRGITLGKKGDVQSCKFYLTNKVIQNAPNSLALRSHQVPNGLPKSFSSSQSILQHVPNSTSLCPIDDLPNINLLEPT